MNCKVCEKLCKNQSVLDSCGDFCSIKCAQIDYEDEWLQDELMTDNPQLDGLDEALLRMI